MLPYNSLFYRTCTNTCIIEINCNLANSLRRGRSPADKSSKTKTPKKGKSPKAETPKGKSPKAETPKGKSPKAEPPKGKSPKAETPKGRTPKTRTPHKKAAAKSPGKKSKTEESREMDDSGVSDVEVGCLPGWYITLIKVTYLR